MKIHISGKVAPATPENSRLIKKATFYLFFFDLFFFLGWETIFGIEELRVKIINRQLILWFLHLKYWVLSMCINQTCSLPKDRGTHYPFPIPGEPTHLLFFPPYNSGSGKYFCTQFSAFQVTSPMHGLSWFLQEGQQPKILKQLYLRSVASPWIGYLLTWVMVNGQKDVSWWRTLVWNIYYICTVIFSFLLSNLCREPSEEERVI